MALLRLTRGLYYVQEGGREGVQIVEGQCLALLNCAALHRHAPLAHEAWSALQATLQGPPQLPGAHMRTPHIPISLLIGALGLAWGLMSLMLGVASIWLFGSASVQAGFDRRVLLQKGETQGRQ